MLNAIAIICGGGNAGADFSTLIKTIAIIGLMCVMLFAIWRARGEDAVSYVIAFAIIYSCLFVPRVTVTVQDHMYADVAPRAPTVVDNVPLGLAFFATVTSRIGYWLTNTFEDVFTMPDTMRYTSTGLMGGSRLLRNAANSEFSMTTSQDMSQFLLYCVYPEMIANNANPAMDALSLKNVIKSTDIWETIRGGINPGRMVSLPSTETLTPCPAAYTTLTNIAYSETETNIEKLAGKTYTGLDPILAKTKLISEMPQAEIFVYNGSINIMNAIRQRMMINILGKSSTNLGNSLDDPITVMTALGTAQAASNANTSFRVSSELAKQSLPFVHNVIELIIVAIFPIVFLMMVAAGPKWGFVARNYVVAMLWIQLWAPIYAVVNYIGMLQVARNAKAALGGINGIAIENAGAIQETLISGEAIAGMMTGLVAVISFALLKGGEVAMSGLVQSVTRPAESAAQAAGSAAGSGKVDMGNVNWGNVTAYNTSANKYDTSWAVNSGYGKAQTGGFGGGTYDNRTGQLTGTNVTPTNSFVKVNDQMLASAANSISNQRDASYVRARSAQLGDSVGANMSDANKAELARAHTKAFEQTFGVDKKLSAAAEELWNIAAGNSKGSAEQAFAKWSGMFGASLHKWGMNAGGDTGLGGQDSTQKGITSEEKDAFNKKLGETFGLASGILDKESDQATKRGSKAFQQGLNKELNATLNKSEEVRKGENAAIRKELNDSIGLGVGVERDSQFARRVIAENYNNDSDAYNRASIEDVDTVKAQTLAQVIKHAEANGISPKPFTNSVDRDLETPEQLEGRRAASVDKAHASHIAAVEQRNVDNFIHGLQNELSEIPGPTSPIPTTPEFEALREKQMGELRAAMLDKNSPLHKAANYDAATSENDKRLAKASIEYEYLARRNNSGYTKPGSVDKAPGGKMAEAAFILAKRDDAVGKEMQELLLNPKTPGGGHNYGRINQLIQESDVYIPNVDTQAQKPDIPYVPPQWKETAASAGRFVGNVAIGAADLAGKAADAVTPRPYSQAIIGEDKK